MSIIYYSKPRKRWRLETEVDGRCLCASAPDRCTLERMQAIIKNNHLSYEMAKKLTNDYRWNKIPPGYIGHQYFYPGPAYRLVQGYINGSDNFNGFICTHYDKAEDAYYDTRIQTRLAQLDSGLQGYDYESYAKSLAIKGYWTIAGITICYSKVNKHGFIRTIKPLKY